MCKVMNAVAVCCAREASSPLRLRPEVVGGLCPEVPLILKLVHTSQLLRPQHRRRQLGCVLEDVCCCAGLDRRKEREEKGGSRAVGGD